MLMAFTYWRRQGGRESGGGKKVNNSGVAFVPERFLGIRWDIFFVACMYAHARVRLCFFSCEIFFPSIYTYSA